MKSRLMTMAVLTVTLMAAGCGDDGGSGSPFGPGAAGNDASSTEGIDGLEDLGDLGSAGDILEDLSDGSLDSGDLEDLMENAEDMAESFGDSGSGTVSINGDTISFMSEICFAGQGDFTIEGPGTSADGTDVWVSINYSSDSRAEMAEFFDEEFLQSTYGDADPIIESSIDLEYGRSELFGESGDDGLPNYNASGGVFGVDDLEMSVDGSTASGSGSATDFSGVSGDFNDRFDFTFEAACS